VSVARFVADQRTMHRVPHTVTCTILGISISWFYKWIGRGPTERQRRRAARDARVRKLFEASQRTYGSPRIHADLLEAGEAVSVNTVADSMRRQGLQGRKPKRRRGLTRQDRSAPKFPDLLHRDFTAAAPNVRWCGDITEIPTDEGKLYFASVLDLYSRRLLASPTSEHPDASLACDAIKMAATVRGGRAAIDGVIFHTDRGSTYTATSFTTLCRKLGVSQSMGRVGSCFDNAAAEAFFSTLTRPAVSTGSSSSTLKSSQ
jgi:putative transposase